MEQQIQERVRLGSAFLETYWFSVAERVINTIIQQWALSEEQGAALKRIYLRPNDYFVECSL
jgi:hypothetical protein